MIDDDLRDHMAAGVVIVIGSVSPSGLPHASRGYGVTPVGDDRIETFLDAADVTAIENLRSTGRVAVTTGDQRTFRSVQFKGSVEQVADATTSEREAALAHLRRFWDRLVFEDNAGREPLERSTPTTFVTCVVHIEAMYDQTPGPLAGGTIEVADR